MIVDSSMCERRRDFRLRAMTAKSRRSELRPLPSTLTGRSGSTCRLRTATQLDLRAASTPAVQLIRDAGKRRLSLGAKLLCVALALPLAPVRSVTLFEDASVSSSSAARRRSAQTGFSERRRRHEHGTGRCTPRRIGTDKRRRGYAYGGGHWHVGRQRGQLETERAARSSGSDGRQG